MPTLTTAQRKEALARAVRARQMRAEVSSELKSGSAKIGDVLAAGHRDDDRGRILARMKVSEVLASFPHIGPIRAEKLMIEIGIASNRRIGGLGARQVEALVTHFENR